MATTIPEGYAEIAYLFSGSAGTPNYVTTIGVDLSVAPADPYEAADLASSCWSIAFADVMRSTLRHEKTLLTLGLDDGVGSVAASNPTYPGNGNAEGAPISMAPIANKVTQRLGRKGRGRMFLPGMLPKDSVDLNGNIGATAQHLIQEACDLFYANLSGIDRDPDLESLYPGLVLMPVLLHGDIADTPTPVQSLTLAPKVGWIRKRLR